MDSNDWIQMHYNFQTNTSSDTSPTTAVPAPLLPCPKGNDYSIISKSNVADI